MIIVMTLQIDEEFEEKIDEDIISNNKFDSIVEEDI